MQATWKTHAVTTMHAVAAFAVVSIVAVPVANAGDAMPVARQNALVQQYCGVCHTDKSLNGGLSLEHFEAAQTDPGVAAMMLKVKSGRWAAAVEHGRAGLDQRHIGGSGGAARGT